MTFNFREQKRSWNANRCAYRRAKRLCQRCGEKLPARESHLTCRPCRDVKSLKFGAGIRAQASARLRERLEFIARTYQTHSLAQQAEALGVKSQTVRWMRWEARRQGYITGPHGNAGRKQSPRWRELDAAQARCRCRLLLPCESCLPSINDLASSRRGPGRVMPEGGP